MARRIVQNTSLTGGEIVKKSTILFILALIGGIIVLLVGVDRLMELINIGSYPGGAGLDGALDLAFGMTCGLLMVVGAIMLSREPQQHRIWGVIVLVFSLLSIIGTAGGVFIGLLLGMIGGMYGIIWKPSIRPS